MVSMVAVVLNTTVAIVERMVAHRPDWLERIDVLAAQFRAVADDAGRRAREDAPDEAAADEAAAEPGETGPQDAEPLLGAYDALWRFTHEIREQGFLLDEEFCARIERDWSIDQLLGYVRAMETTLREKAEAAQSAANGFLAQTRGE